MNYTDVINEAHSRAPHPQGFVIYMEPESHFGLAVYLLADTIDQWKELIQALYEEAVSCEVDEDELKQWEPFLACSWSEDDFNQLTGLHLNGSEAEFAGTVVQWGVNKMKEEIDMLL